MKELIPLDIGRLYEDHRNEVFGAVRARFCRSSLSDEDLEDIIQDLFAQLLRNKLPTIDQQNFGFLWINTVRKVLDFLRKRNCQKRGGKMLFSLEKALEDGFDFPSIDQTPRAQALETADLVIAAATTILSERQLIVLRHIRAAADQNSALSLSDLADSLACDERIRFLPVRGSVSTEEEHAFIVKQVSRSRSTLFRCLKRVRDEMNAQGL